MKKHLFAILIASTLTLGGCSLVAPLSMIDNYRPSTPTSYSTSTKPWWISSTTSTPWWVSTSKSTSTPWWVSTSESTSTPWWVSTSKSTSTPWWVSTSEPTSQPTSTPWWVSTSPSSGESFTSLSTTTPPYSNYYEISLDNLGTTNYPWVYDGKYYKSTNEGIASSQSTMRITFNVSGTFSFDYMSNSENGCDLLTVTYYSPYIENENTIVNVSSLAEFVYHDLDVDEGSYLEFCFSKDGSVNYEEDCAKIRNLYFEPSPSLSTSESTSDSSSPSGDSYEISLDNEGSSKDYPWSYDGYEYKSTNEDVDSSESVMRITFKETGTFSFYYMCYCESGCDYLYINHYFYWSNSWGYVLESSHSSPDYYDVEVFVESGDYLEFGYHKDGSVSSYDDCAKIKNLSFSYSY